MCVFIARRQRAWLSVNQEQSLPLFEYVINVYCKLLAVGTGVQISSALTTLSM